MERRNVLRALSIPHVLRQLAYLSTTAGACPSRLRNRSIARVSIAGFAGATRDTAGYSIPCVTPFVNQSLLLRKLILEQLACDFQIIVITLGIDEPCISVRSQ